MYTVHPSIRLVAGIDWKRPTLSSIVLQGLKPVIAAPAPLYLTLGIPSFCVKVCLCNNGKEGVYEKTARKSVGLIKQWRRFAEVVMTLKIIYKYL